MYLNHVHANGNVQLAYIFKHLNTNDEIKILNKYFKIVFIGLFLSRHFKPVKVAAQLHALTLANGH